MLVCQQSMRFAAETLPRSSLSGIEVHHSVNVIMRRFHPVINANVDAGISETSLAILQRLQDHSDIFYLHATLYGAEGGALWKEISYHMLPHYSLEWPSERRGSLTCQVDIS